MAFDPTPKDQIWIGGLLTGWAALVACPIALGWHYGIFNAAAGYILLALAGIILASVIGLFLGGKLTPPVATDPWVKSYQTLIVAPCVAAVTLVAAYFAFSAMQQQISHQQQLFDAQQLETRKQRRLDYLRQYLPQLDDAVQWMDSLVTPILEVRFALMLGIQPISPSRPVTLLRSDEDLAKILELQSVLKAMPKMPFYPGRPPAYRRDALVRDLDELQHLISQIKATGAMKIGGRVTDEILARQFNFGSSGNRVGDFEGS